MKVMFVVSAATLFGTLSAAINSTADRPDCPYLYNRLPGGPCITAYGMHQAPWADARLFCNSIFGELLVVDNVTLFANLVQFFNQSGIEGDFWIGGRKDSQGEWKWTDNKPMTMGTPYWSLRYTCNYVSSCRIIQTPYLREDVQKLCVAMTHSSYYYFTNENCSDKRSPLCVFKGANDMSENLEEMGNEVEDVKSPFFG